MYADVGDVAELADAVLELATLVALVNGLGLPETQATLEDRSRLSSELMDLRGRVADLSERLARTS